MGHEREWPSAGFKDAAGEVRNSLELVPLLLLLRPNHYIDHQLLSYHLEMRRRVSGATDLAPLTTQLVAPQLFSLHISDTNHCVKALKP